MTLPPHGPPEITEAQQAATSLGEVADPSPDNVSRALQDYSPYAVAAAAAALGASGGGGGGSQPGIPLDDPGNVWAPNSAVIDGYQIAETVQGELRVFEVTTAGTTGSSGAFSDYLTTSSLVPLAETQTDTEVWAYLGIVGQVSWEFAPQEQSFGEAANGPYVAGREPISEAEATFRILPALEDPGNEWEALTPLADAGYGISVTAGGALRVFELIAAATTGASEPAWLYDVVGQQTTDDAATWTYMGVVGGPATTRPVFITNSAGDADWYLDTNNGSGFRFNLSEDGVPSEQGMHTEFTTDGFKVTDGAESSFEIEYDPFVIRVSGLPTSDPGEGFTGVLWNDAGTMKIADGLP